MSFDAFTGGIDPGGLRTQSDIRLLICYLLASVKAPLSKSDIVSILQENGLANYFEAADALSEMLEKEMQTPFLANRISVWPMRSPKKLPAG